MADMRLGDLVEQVLALDPSADAVRHITDAVGYADRLTELADDLVGHFVDAARAEGVSWTRIGTAIGVSKQAAQQRFVVRDAVPDLEHLTARKKPAGLFRRFTPRSRHVVDTAGVLAAEHGHHEVRPEHLLLALLTDSESLAVRALGALGATPDAIRAVLVPRLGPADSGEPPRRARWSPEAKRVLRGAVEQALLFEHNYIGTEHLLLGLLDERAGAAVEALGQLDVTPGAAAAEFTRLWAAT